MQNVCRFYYFQELYFNELQIKLDQLQIWPVQSQDLNHKKLLKVYVSVVGCIFDVLARGHLQCNSCSDCATFWQKDVQLV